MEQLEALLSHFLMPDNATRRQAEEAIKHLARDPAIVPALLCLVRTSHSDGTRQLAAVIMRKKITGHWMKLPPEVKENVKASLLESVATEPSAPVRRASADVVSVIAKHTVPAGEWPALLQFLFQCSQSPGEDHREVALILFSSLTETIGDILRPHFTTLHAIFVSGLRDQHSIKVRVAAVKAVGALVDYLESEQEVAVFRELVGPILDVARVCLLNGDETVAVKTCEILDEFMELPGATVGPVLSSIVQFSLELTANTSLELTTRRQAAEIVAWMAQWKPKALVKEKLVVPILSTLCPLLASPDNVDSMEDLSVPKFIAQVIDAMAMGLPKKHIFPPVLEFSRSKAGSSRSAEREAAMMALAAVTEGCSESVRKRLPEILNLLLPAMRDEAQEVRGAACFAVGQLAEYVQPETADYFEQILPAIFSVLNDASSVVQEKAYYALAAFCENLEDEILPYLDQLMRMLLQALQSSQRDLQEICLSAIGSAAAAAEKDFQPYAEGLLTLMRPVMESKMEQDLSVRAKALELVGIVGLACGREGVQHHLPYFLEAAIQGFSLDHSELREYSHGFFGQMSQLLGADFAQFLPRVVPLAIASCELDDGTVLDFADPDEDKVDTGLGGLSSDESEEEDEKRLRSVSIRTGVLDEKSAATQALGLYAQHTKAAFTPYLEQTLSIMEKHAGYFHEDVRLQAMLALQHMVTAAEEAYQLDSPANGGPIALAPEVRHVYGKAMNLYLRAVNDDEDQDTVSQACTSLAFLVKKYGSVPLEPYLQKLCETTLALLKAETLCQQSADSEEEGQGYGGEDEDDDGDEVHENILMDAGTDLLPAIAEVMGGAFDSYFRTFFPELKKIAETSRHAGDRSMAIGCIAEVAKYLGPPVSAYVDALMAVVIQEIGSTHAPCRRNAAFCAGILCWHGGDTAVPYYGRLLMALHPLFGQGEDAGVRDNGTGAVARMIAAHPEAVPLAKVLPIFIASLPLKEDLDEASPVYGCLCSLINGDHPEIRPHIPGLVPLLAHVAALPETPSEPRDVIVRTIAELRAKHPAEMEAIIGGLPPSDAAALGPALH